MKPKYSHNLFAGLILAAVFSLTSCSKENLQMPEPIKSNTENSAMAMNATQTMAAGYAESIQYGPGYFKAINSWTGTNGFTPPVLRVYTIIMRMADSHGDSKYVSGELYQAGPSGSLTFVASNVGNSDYCCITFSPQQGYRYYFRATCQMVGKYVSSAPAWGPTMSSPNSTFYCLNPGSPGTTQGRMFYFFFTVVPA